MFAAYKIGITVAITNQVSSVLGLISRDFAKADASALRFKATLREIKLYGMGGLLLGGLGIAGLDLVSKLVKPASAYAHQLNIMNMAGLSHVEIAQAVGAAWKNTSTVITTSATDNLKSLLDLRNILTETGFKPGDPVTMKLATDQLEFVTKMQAVMAASKEGALSANAGDFSFQMAKALDMLGAVDPADFKTQGEAMGKVITAFQGRVPPKQYMNVFQYARQGKFDLSNDFKYQLGLPTLLLEMSNNGGGGGQRGPGAAIAAMYRFTNQGYINKKSIPLLDRLGLLTDHDFTKTTTPGTVGSHLRGSALAAQNPFLWTQQVLVPAIQKAYGPNVTTAQEREVVGQLVRGNQLAASFFMEFLTKPGNFYRDQAIIQGAMGLDSAYTSATSKDPKTAFAALSTQWVNLETALGHRVLPMLISGVNRLTDSLNALSLWVEAHPHLTDTLVIGFTALSGAMAIGGTLLVMTAAFKGLGLAMAMGGLGGMAAQIGLMATGFMRMAGPIGIIVGALELLGPSKAFKAQQDEWDRNHGLNGESTWTDRMGKWFGGSGSSNSTIPDGYEGPQSLRRKDDSSSNAGLVDAIKAALGNMSVKMDGRTVGNIVFGAVARDYGANSTGLGRFDFTQSPAVQGAGP